MGRIFNAIALVTLVSWGSIASPAAAVASIPPPPAAPAAATQGLASDAAATRVLALRDSISSLQGECAAIDARLVVTSRYILDQSDALDRADEALSAAQRAFDARAVAIYKFDEHDMLGMVLDSSSWTDLIARLTVLRRMAEADQSVLEELRLVASEARDQAGRLEQVRQQDVDLRTVREDRLKVVQGELAEQEALAGQVTAAGRSALDAQARGERASRAAWKAATIPPGTRIRKVEGRVLEHPTVPYLTSEFHYRTYRVAGPSSFAICSWYGAEFDGRATASGQAFNSADFTCAHRSLPFGTWLALTRYDSRTKTTKRIVVVVNDRGPYVDGRDIDLSRAAADALGFASAGVARVGVEIVTPVR